jgi:hypothetical protein
MLLEVEQLSDNQKLTIMYLKFITKHEVRDKFTSFLRLGELSFADFDRGFPRGLK